MTSITPSISSSGSSASEGPLSAGSSHVSSSSSYIFHPVIAKSTEMRDLTKIFEDVLKPLYGPQEDALRKIELGKDRQSFLLYNDITPIGVIVFKTVLSDEFQKEGIKNSIEIKSLFVVNAGQNSGRGVGTILLNKVIDEIGRMSIKATSLHVTVSEERPESLTFFKKKGFMERFFWVNKYAENVKEWVLSCPLEELGLSNQPRWVKTLEKKPEDGKLKEKEKVEEKDFGLKQKLNSPRILGYVQNAHWGDIHALKLLSDGTFVSGSKDNSLSKWSRDGKVVRNVFDVEPNAVDPKNWITSMVSLNEDYWLSGERNGKIALWNTSGDFISFLMPKLPKNDHFCHEDNRRRVTCLAASTNKQKLSFFAGFPTLFDEYSVIERRTLSRTLAHSNDWVYCIHPLQEDQILAVTAGNLDGWKKVDGIWTRTANLVQEPKKRVNRRERPHISSLTCLESSPEYFGMSVFGGHVNVVNIKTGQTVKKWKGHEGNVWATANVSKDLFASSGQDGVVRFWDVRLKESAFSVSIGTPVTSLMRLNMETLVAGTCPEGPLKKEGASLVFYDIRK